MQYITIHINDLQECTFYKNPPLKPMGWLEVAQTNGISHACYMIGGEENSYWKSSLPILMDTRTCQGSQILVENTRFHFIDSISLILFDSTTKTPKNRWQFQAFL